MSELTVALRLLLDGRQFDGGLNNSGRNVGRFGNTVRREIASLRNFANSAAGQLAKAGVGFGGYAVLRQSAKLDQSLNQVRQTAGATRLQTQGLRDDLFAMTRDSGRQLEGLRGGFNNLIASGLEWKQALMTIRAINPASVVTGASEDILAGGLTVGAAAFRFDLSQPGVATKLLDQMTVAGRLGNAELEDLASIFARVGVNAKSANFEFGKTLGFIEGLSLIERNPERLATLADSTLRLFTNAKYKAGASKAAGVSFYNGDGSSREPFDVLSDISKGFQAQRTDQARDRFVSKAFGETDLDTQRGLKALLAPGALDQIRRMSELIENAGGTVKRDLDDSMDNAVNQAGRVKAIFSKIGDDVARPINRALADAVDQGVRPRSEGGYGLSNNQVLGVGAGALVGGAIVQRATSALLRKIPGVGGILGDSASTAAGVAQGKALQAAAGVTPVFVTNWPGSAAPSGAAGNTAAAALAGAGGASLLARAGGVLRALPGVGALSGLIAANGAAMAGGFATAAGATGYGIGSLIYKGIDETRFADRLGAAIASVIGGYTPPAREADKDLGGTLKIEIDASGTVRLREARRNSTMLDFDITSGPMMVGN